MDEREPATLRERSSAMDPDEFNHDRAEAAAAAQRSRRLAEWHAHWKALNWPWKLLATLLAILATIWLVLFITKGRFLKHPVERIASGVIGRDVTVAGDFQLYFAPFDIKFRAEGMTIANPAWATDAPFFRARLIDSRIGTGPLIFGRRVIRQLTLDGAAIDLRWSPDGRSNSWTFGDPDQPARSLELPDIRRAAVTGTGIHYDDPGRQLIADIRVDKAAAADTQIMGSIAFKGGGSLRAIPFTLDGALLSPNQAVAGQANRLAFHARSGGTRLDIAGTLPGPTRIDGAKLQMRARGPDLSRLFDFLGIATPQTRRYDLTAALNPIDGEWRFRNIAGHYGETDLTGSMTLSVPKERLLLVADLHSDKLHMIDIAPFIGYDPARIEAAGASGIVTEVDGTPRILPDAPLRVDAVRRFDARVDYSVRTVVGRDIPISNIGLKLDLDNGLLKLAPVTFIMAGGFFAANVAIDARTLPITTDYDIRLSPSPMGKLLARWGVEESGTTGTIRARVQMKGVGDTVRKSLASSNGRIAVIMPKGTMWARNIQLSELDIGTFVQKMFTHELKEPVQINCGLVAFTVRDGVASADPILIDTSKNVILGRGAFSFRDESLDLALRADGKTFSLFSGQSPIGLGGHFAEPKINPVSPELVGRAAAGIGLGALLSPLASVIAFVDIGDAKAADCGPVLAGAQAHSQRTSKGKARDDVGSGTPSKREKGD